MKKVKRKYRDPRILATVMILMVFFLGELLFYTWCRVQCVQIKYEISKITDKQRRLTAMRDSLKVELAHLKSPQRIAEIAKNKLGLITPTPSQMIQIP